MVAGWFAQGLSVSVLLVLSVKLRITKDSLSVTFSTIIGLNPPLSQSGDDLDDLDCLIFVWYQIVKGGILLYHYHL